MPHALYVCLQDDNKIAVFTMDPDTGQLVPGAEVPVAGGPSVLALSPDLPGPTPGVGNQPDRENPELSCDVIRLAGAIPKQVVAGSCAIRPGSLVSLTVT